MNTIIFKVTGNRLTRVGGYDPVSGEKKYTEFRFEFDSEWNGVRSITVTMFFDVREPQNIVVDVENGVALCNIEEELRNKSGILWVGVSGYDTVSGATLDCYLTALPVGEGTKVTEVATTLLYQQIVELVGRIETKLPVSTVYIKDLAVTTAKLADGAVTGDKVKDNVLTPNKFDREYWEHLNRSTINTYADLDNIIATDTKLNTAFTVMFTGLSPIKRVVGEGTFFVLKSNTSESLLLINVDNGEMWSYTQGANEVTRASVTKEDLAVTTEKLANGAVTGDKVKKNTLTPDKFDRSYWEKKVFTQVIDTYTGLFSSIVPINSGGSICIAKLNIITGKGLLSGYCEIVAVLEDTGNTRMYITNLYGGTFWTILKEKDSELYTAFKAEDVRYLTKSYTNLGEVIEDFDTLFQKVGYISRGGTVGFVKILVSGKDKVTVTGNDGVLDGEFMAVGSPTYTNKTVYLRNLYNGECWTVLHNGDGSYLATKIDALTPRVERLEKYSVINLGVISSVKQLNVAFKSEHLYRFSFSGELAEKVGAESDCLGTYGYENGPGGYLKFINFENGKSGLLWLETGSYVENSGSGGADGEDGTSVTILSISESAEDSGSNIVTFSSGETLTIKNGAKGTKGDKGDTGVQGPQGEPGEKGETGAAGPKGDTGAKGEPGEQGPKGEKGETGATGEKGINGVSATHVWNGTVLTVTSASGTTSSDLKGDKGDPGAQGPQGEKGEKGEKGDKGDTGTQGVKGDKGDKGDNYILTPADKAEIAEQVESATIVPPPLYVDSLDKMTDTNKVYVLSSTGHIFAYMDTTVKGTVTEKIEGTADNPYQVGRFSSNGTLSTDVSDYVITPYIDLTKAEYVGKTIQLHLEGLRYVTETNEQYVQSALFKTDKSVLNGRSATCLDKNYGILTAIANLTAKINGTTSATLTITIPPSYNGTAIGYMRFCAKGVEADSNIYVTYEGEVSGGQWVDTGTTYAPTLTETDKQEIAEDVAAMIDTQLLTVVGDGVVTV